MQQQKNDEATMCFHLCSEKALNSENSHNLRIAAKAQRMKAQVLFYKYYDFEHASNILASAKQICEQNHYDDIIPSILLEEAGFYTTYASQNPSKKNFTIGEDAYRKALNLAIKQKDKRTAASAFSNMINRFYGEHRYKEMRELLVKYSKLYTPTDTNPSFIFANTLYKGFSEIVKSDNIMARKVFRNAVMHKSIAPRYKFELNVAIVRTFLAENNLDSAIAYEHHLLELSRKFQLKDGEAVVLSDLGKLYEVKGDTAQAHYFNYCSMLKKDSLINVRRLDKVHNIEFLQNLYNLEHEVNNSKLITRNLVIAIMVIALLLVITGVVYVRRSRRAKDATNTEGTHAEPKYQNSTLGDYAREIIEKRISEIIDTPDEAIFNPNFSVDSLADMCKTNTHYVSQIINEKYKINFSTLINQVRINEACCRICDVENYGNYTLESIGLSVGYSSRVSFTNAFKRIKNTTPSQYRDSIVK